MNDQANITIKIHDIKCEVVCNNDLESIINAIVGALQVVGYHKDSVINVFHDEYPMECEPKDDLKIISPDIVGERELLLAFTSQLNREHITQIEIADYDSVVDAFLEKQESAINTIEQ